MKALRQLFKLRRWFKSKTLSFFGLATFLAGLDASVFDGGLGQLVIQVISSATGLSGSSATAALVGIGSGVGIILRAVTSEPLDAKDHK